MAMKRWDNQQGWRLKLLVNPGLYKESEKVLKKFDVLYTNRWRLVMKGRENDNPDGY